MRLESKNGKEFIKRYRNGVRNFSGLELKDINFTIYPEFTEYTCMEEEKSKQTDPLIFTESNFIRCSASGVNFSNIYAPRANFSNSNLASISFYNANLDGAIFHHSNLRKANFRHTYLHGADFEGANISGAHIINSFLEFAKLKGTIAIETFFRFSNLSNSSFDKFTILKGADFAWANLTYNCDLHKSSYNEAIFHQTLVTIDDLKKLERISKNEDNFVVIKDLKRLLKDNL